MTSMTQQELLAELNKEFSLELEGTDDDKFCRWDATSPKYLAELKCRRAHYNTQMIEYDKLDCVKAEADKTDKEFLYCVSTPEGMYVAMSLTGRTSTCLATQTFQALIIRLRRLVI